MNDQVFHFTEKLRVKDVEGALTMLEREDFDSGKLSIEQIKLFEQLLLHSSIYREPPGTLGIAFAAKRGRLKVVERLLKNDKIININGAFQSACAYGHLEIVKLLLRDKRLDPCQYKNWALQYSFQSKLFTIVAEIVADRRIDTMCFDMPHFDRVQLISKRAAEICIGLQDLHLPALVSLEIIDALFPTNVITMFDKWNLICKVKHFLPCS